MSNLENRVKTLTEYLVHRPVDSEFFNELKTTADQIRDTRAPAPKNIANWQIFQGAVAKVLCFDYLQEKTPESVLLIPNVDIICHLQKIANSHGLLVPPYFLSFSTQADTRNIFSIPDAIELDRQRNSLRIGTFLKFHPKPRRDPSVLWKEKAIAQNPTTRAALTASVSQYLGISEQTLFLPQPESIALKKVVAQRSHGFEHTSAANIRYEVAGINDFNERCFDLLDRML